jgi:acetoin:2,6-dichlorophenolindophenol oxidoreductase subunit beta
MSTLEEAPVRAEIHEEDVELSYREAICAALSDEMSTDPTVVLLGEDVAEAGGVFKTSEGLFEQFGATRVLNTPICENGFVGAAIGMAVTGLRPVVEIMFSDFLPSAGDAIVVELPKLRFVSGGQCAVPVTVRSISGAGGRFGTQHSATGESWYVGLPGLLVATAGSPAAAYAVLRAAIRENNPVLFFEHKLLYGRKGTVHRGDTAVAEVGRAAVERTGADITVVATLLMADRCVRAADSLAAEGVSVEVIDLRWLRPLDLPTVEESVAKTGRLLVVEEQVHAGGWGATVISQVAIHGGRLKTPPRALSLPDDLLIPYSPSLEDEIIPGEDQIASAIRDLIDST